MTLSNRLFCLSVLVLSATLNACGAKNDSDDKDNGSGGAGGSSNTGATGSGATGGENTGGSTGGAGGTGGSGATAGSGGLGGSGGTGAMGGSNSGGSAGQSGGSGGSAGTGMMNIENGQACNDPSDCVSGSCVDNICCSTACSGACEGCAEARTGEPDGTCGLVKMYLEPQTDECNGKLCGGNSATCLLHCISSSECVEDRVCSFQECQYYKRVFITSSLHDGNIGGVSAADSICQNLASSAGLSGTYLAWLGDSSGTPLDRFSQYDGPYASVDRNRIANTWQDLTDGQMLDASINKDENGELHNDQRVWMGMFFSGSTPATHCADWSSNSASETGAAYSLIWATKDTLACNQQLRFVCVEQ